MNGTDVANRARWNVGPSRYGAVVDMRRRPHDPPFPVSPEDVPDDAVRAVKRTLLRNSVGEPMDDELARLVVWVVIASLSQPGVAPRLDLSYLASFPLTLISDIG